MSEWTISLPLFQEEVLVVDMRDKQITGYRVVSEEEGAPQTVVGGIVEAICFSHPLLASSALMELTADLASSIADEIKAREIKKNDFRYLAVFCSQCGKSFGPSNHGFSHCEDHAEFPVVES